MRHRLAVGLIAGRKTLRPQAVGAMGARVESTKALTATRDGFSLNASVACRAAESEKLERNRWARHVTQQALELLLLLGFARHCGAEREAIMTIRCLNRRPPAGSAHQRNRDSRGAGNSHEEVGKAIAVELEKMKRGGVLDSINSRSMQGFWAKIGSLDK